MPTRLQALLALTLLTGCAVPLTPEQQVIADAAAALGGRERLLAVRTMTLEGEGTQFNLGQDMTPDARGQTFSVAGLTRRIDLTSNRSRTELTRTPDFAYFQGPQPQRQVQGVDGEVGYNVAANGNATRASAQVAADRRADLLHHPLAAVRAALAAGATVSNARTQGSERLVDVAAADGTRFVLAVDGTGLPARVESRASHANLGDITNATLFADYGDASGLKVPGRLTTKVDDFTTAELRLAKHAIDGDVGDLAAPQAAAAAPPPTPAAPNVVAEAIAPGVWLLAGQSHHSALIELSDRLVLVDAPQSEARTLAVIAKARELVAGKPLSQVITTHHHFDHTAGIRAAIAEGLTVVTHEGNRAFFERMAQRTHSIVADTLAKKPRPATVETVGDESIVNDKLRTVAIYHVAGSPHSDTMLMVHLPRERVVIQVDLFSVGSAVNPYAANVLENITKRKLAVDRIVPLHGAVMPLSELVKVVNPS